MFKIIVTTQYCENYDMDGGNYWKFKGGDEIEVGTITQAQRRENPRIHLDIVDGERERIEHANDYSMVYITSIRLEPA